jgi:hypothetical protein
MEQGAEICLGTIASHSMPEKVSVSARCAEYIADES